MGSVGLVLGAGGIAGQADHAGRLAAIEAETGWDPRSARLIVGTSAGSITATLLRAGVPAADLAAWVTRAPLSAEGRRCANCSASSSRSWNRCGRRIFCASRRYPAPA